MTQYAVGDLQGCLDPLLCLLEEVQFDLGCDELWLVGDVVNRGPQSLQTLRYLYSIRSRVRMVLGNHDLNLLAVAEGYREQHKSDTLAELLAAADSPILLDWLRQQPLLYHDSQTGFAMVHAGIPPQWSLSDALERSAEVETVLRGDDYRDFLREMYGNQPDCWNDQLTGTTRLKVITNYLTRMRFCAADGRLDLVNKTCISNLGSEYRPWFSHAGRKTRDQSIAFGHWAALAGVCDEANAYALDTGCVWGRHLTMMRLDDQELFTCQCAAPAEAA